ncbi:MAG TPA: hypothetical protein VF627_10305, partial [Abditibacterium sp.]
MTTFWIANHKAAVPTNGAAFAKTDHEERVSQLRIYLDELMTAIRATKGIGIVSGHSLNRDVNGKNEKNKSDILPRL